MVQIKFDKNKNFRLEFKEKIKNFMVVFDSLNVTGTEFCFDRFVREAQKEGLKYVIEKKESPERKGGTVVNRVELYSEIDPKNLRIRNKCFEYYVIGGIDLKEKDLDRTDIKDVLEYYYVLFNCTPVDSFCYGGKEYNARFDILNHDDDPESILKYLKTYQELIRQNYLEHDFKLVFEEPVQKAG